jgi:putative membrane protein
MEAPMTEAIVHLADLLTAPLLADSNGPGWWVVFFPLGWFLVIAALILLFRRSRWGWGCGPAGRGYGRPLSAGEVLERRFAEGELSAEEFRQRRALLAEPPDSRGA